MRTTITAGGNEARHSRASGEGSAPPCVSGARILVIACVAPGSGLAAEAPDLGAGAHVLYPVRSPTGCLVRRPRSSDRVDGVDWRAESATEKLFAFTRGG